MDEVEAAFRRFKGILFLLEPCQKLYWARDDYTWLPTNQIFAGPQDSARPVKIFSPYEIYRVECTKPRLFRPGRFTAYDMDDRVLFEFAHKDKQNCINADDFNYYLDLYRYYELPD